MPTVKGVLQKYHEGQNIFRREAVSCLVSRIEQVEKYVASQQSVQPTVEACSPDRHIYYTAFLSYIFCPYCGERLHSG